MKAIVLDQPGQFSYKESKAPSILPRGYALVRIHRIGICGTDLHAYQGKQTFFTYPRILGHELGVEIAELAENSKGFSVGDFCTVEPFLNCGTCVACRRGKPNCCTHLQVLGVHIDGGMRNFMSVPIRKLHKTRSLSLDQLAMVEPLSIGAHGIRRAGIEPGENTLIIGVGPIGLAAVVSSIQAGARIMVMDISEARLSFCRDVMKVDLCVDARKDIVSQLESFCDGELPTAVIDCTGSSQSMAASFHYVSHGGKVVFIGHFPGDLTFDYANFHKRELTLMASRASASEDFKHVIALLEARQIDVNKWITHRVQCQQVIEAFPGWLDPSSGVVKVMVEWS